MRLLPALIAAAIRLTAATWRVRRVGRELMDEALARGPVVFAFRHGEQLAIMATHLGLDITPVVSLSRDGDLAAAVIARLGYGAVRGSSSRGGAAAMAAGRELLGSGRSLALTVDGPRGPAGRPKPGAAALARSVGAPICWVRAEAAPAWRAGSWDRFLVPLPFARIVVRTGLIEPVDVGAATAALAEALRE